MNEKLKVGQTLEFMLPTEDGGVKIAKGELLPRLAVCFGIETEFEEQPVDTTSQDEAVRIVHMRFPTAFFDNWFSKAGNIDSVNSTVEEGIYFIQRDFYPRELDVLRDDLLPTGSRGKYRAGTVKWFLTENDSSRKP